MGTGGPFPGGKVRLGRDADHSPPSSAEVKNKQEHYLLSLHALPWRVAGSLYLNSQIRNLGCITIQSDMLQRKNLKDDLLLLTTKYVKELNKHSRLNL
jgi:hypothetical protein